MRVIDITGREVAVSPSASSSGFIEGTSPGAGGIVELIAEVDGTRRRATLLDVYRTNPYLFACIQLLARSMSRFPLKVYRNEGDTTVRIRKSDGGRAGSLAAALRRPGHRRSQRTLWNATTTDRLVFGNAVWFPDRDRAGDYTGMRRIPWRYAQHETIAGVLRYWDARKPDAKRLADDVVHFGAGLDCDELINPSLIGSLHATLALYDAVTRHLVAYFKNSARPSGHLQVSAQTSGPNRELIRAEMQKLYSGPANAGKVMITSGEWTSIDSAPANNQVIELARQSREEICAAVGTPPPTVGILDRAIMSNVKELRSHLARDVVGPHAGLFEGDIDAQLIATDPMLGDDIEVEFEMAATLRPDLEARSATWKNQRYLLSLNEMRQIEGKPRIDHPDADIPWMPLNEAPLGSDNSPRDHKTEHDQDPDGPEEDPT